MTTPDADPQRQRLLLAYALARGRGNTALAAHLRELGAGHGITAREFDEVSLLEGLLDRALAIDSGLLAANLAPVSAPVRF